MGVELTNTADTAWRTPTLLNGWVNYGQGFPVARYRKHATGQVEVQGLISSGTTAGATPVLNLPVGYRSTSIIMVTTLSNNVLARIDLQTTGDLQIIFGASTVYLSLNFVFTAEA